MPIEGFNLVNYENGQTYQKASNNNLQRTSFAGPYLHGITLKKAPNKDEVSFGKSLHKVSKESEMLRKALNEVASFKEVIKAKMKTPLKIDGERVFSVSKKNISQDTQILLDEIISKVDRALPEEEQFKFIQKELEKTGKFSASEIKSILKNNIRKETVNLYES